MIILTQYDNLDEFCQFDRCLIDKTTERSIVSLHTFFTKTRLEASIKLFFTGRFPPTPTFIAFHQILQKWKLGISHLWRVSGSFKKCVRSKLPVFDPVSPCLFLFGLHVSHPLPPQCLFALVSYSRFSKKVPRRLWRLFRIKNKGGGGMKREKRINFFVNST